MKSKIVLFLILVSSVFAQQQQSDEIVTVPKKYVSAEGLNHQVVAVPTTPQQVSQWVGVGKEVGTAVRDGLDAVVDKAEKFGTTKVGTFVMVMIAWKIMAKEVLHVVLGIPFLIGGICIWFWAAKRLFFGYRVLAKKEGSAKIYEDHDPYLFESRESRAAAGLFLWVSLISFMSVMMAIIFL